MSIGLSANKLKIGDILVRICEQMPDIHLRKLLKVLYFIDEKSMIERAIPVTWLDYYAWKKGPVAPEVFEIKNGAFSDFVTCAKDSDGRYHINAKKYDDKFSQLSKYELQLVDDVIARCKDKSADELTDETHQEDTLWSRVVKENNIDFEKDSKSDVPILLVRLNEDDTEAQELYYEARDCVMMQASVNQM